MEIPWNSSAHVLMFPIPAQGHITPMLHLSELFCLANIQVTFLITTENHQLLNQHTTINERFARYPSFMFKIIPPPCEQPQQGGEDHVVDMIRLLNKGLASSSVPLLRELLTDDMAKVTCFIIDGWLSFAYDVANEAQVPVIAFRCPSASYFWSFLFIPLLIQTGELPFKGLTMDLPWNSSARVLMFPIPAQGHITPLLHLSELLCLANIQVTFLITTENHQLLSQHTTINERFAGYPTFMFKVIPPQAPSNDQPQPPHQGGHVVDMIRLLNKGLASIAEPLLRELLIESNEMTKVTCFIIDGWLSFAYDIANEAKVNVFAFRSNGACYSWSCVCTPKLIQAGELPFEDEEMDLLVKNVPGMSSFLRYRDLPSLCRGHDKSSCLDLEQFLASELQRNKNVYGFIFNTFEDLEGPILSNIRSNSPRVYPIGPLHAHLKYRLGKENTPLSNNSSSSLWEVDQCCMSWLDQKPNKSVVYVSFGSVATLTRDQLMEIWAGLVRSNKYFLWVVRPNVILDGGLDSPTPDELLEGTKKRGYMVKWAPQDEVLAHRAVGGFLTHSGWNSILESIVAGVPMLCWPNFGDQQINSRFVSEVWKIGLDMKDTCDRAIVEKMINDLMAGKKDELKRSMDRMSHLANRSISEGGSSCSNLNQLIEDIRSMAKKG